MMGYSMLLLLAAAVALSNGLACTMKEGVIIGNNQISLSHADSYEDCCSMCNAVPNCVAYTFDTDSHECYLKDNVEGVEAKANRISGTNGRTPADTWDACTQANTTSLPFCDISKSFAERAADLASRVQLNEIGQQLTARESPSISRLGLPSYYWGTNAIHGMQNTECLADGQCPTSFPAPNALSATFNFSLVHDMGNIIGKELRAYYHNHSHNSLDTWSPTINLNRDPRWGRNVESPGEDPFVCGQYGAAYTQGLQGNDPKVVQAVVTLKHWIAYSVESFGGFTRHTYDAIVSAYDLQDSYFPAWEHTVKVGGALGVMCSYNELNGVPTCGNPNLTSILRDDWGFQGYITSDSDAVGDIWKSHKYEPDAEHATRDGLEAGCDIDSGHTYYDNVEPAVTKGLVDKKYAYTSMARITEMRMRMGLFDPHVPNQYRNMSTDVVGSAEHQASSLMGSRKAMVLLKNENNVLPFAKGKKIAVIGESSNSTNDLLGNYVGPICADKTLNCFPTLFQQIEAQNTGGTTTLNDKVGDIDAAVAAAKAADLIVLTASNAHDGGGEGHDRTTISLAADQMALAQAIIAVNKPLVLVLINGGIIAIDNLKEQCPGIIEAFMPGVHGAQAIAETIFGDNNPGGKMPVTMYNSSYINDVDMLNMSMTNGAGRSYKYYTGTPLYPFGYGLSYTTFDVKWSPNPPSVASLGAGASQTYTVTVTNTGSVAGDEVVIAYFKPDRSSFTTRDLTLPTPIKQVFGFQRVSLEPNASTKITFTLNSETLALVEADGRAVLHSGRFQLEFSRGHGEVLTTDVHVKVAEPKTIKPFRKWW